MNKDYEFSITREDGREVKCQILSILPIIDQDFYVVFTDGEEDSDGVPIFKYGKMVDVDGLYELKGNITPEELDKVQNNFAKEIQTLVDQYKR